MMRSGKENKIIRLPSTLRQHGFSHSERKSAEAAPVILSQLAQERKPENSQEQAENKTILGYESQVIEKLLVLPEVVSVDVVTAGRAKRLGANFVISLQNQDITHVYLSVTETQKKLEYFIKGIKKDRKLKSPLQVAQWLEQERIIVLVAEDKEQVQASFYEALMLIIAYTQKLNSSQEDNDFSQK